MSINLFKSERALNIPGCKEQTINQHYVSFDPDFVYAPLTRNGVPLKELRKVGDYVFRGTILAVDEDKFPVFSSVSGQIVDKKRMPFADGLKTAFVIKNDHKGTFELRKPLNKVAECSPAEIRDAIKYSGCVGFGGAGFPTYLKYQNKCDYIIVNAVECEPYLNSDYQMGLEHMDLAFEAFPYLLKISNAKKVFIAIKENKPKLIREAERCLKKFQGLPVEIVKIPDIYPIGYERNIVRHIVHKEYKTLPIEAGVIVNNLYTMIMLGETFLYGTVPVTRCLTVAGLVNKPQTIFTPAYVLASDLINFCGGKSTNKETVLLDGGPMTAHTFKDDFVICLETGGVIVMLNKMKKPEPCMHCGECCNQCPMDLQPVQIQMALKKKDIKRLVALEADKCINCGLCSYVCPSKINVSSNVQLAKGQVIKAKREENA